MPLLPELATPCLLVDVDRLDANIATMAELARRLGVALRPHAKTHKSVEIARRQLAAGAHGLTVATVSEAEIFAAAGCDDLFIAYPLYATAALGERLSRLATRSRLAVGVDSAEGARALATHLAPAARSVVRLLVEVDSGQHRTGVLPEEAGPLADQVMHCGLQVAGAFTFPGHSYSPDVRGGAAVDEAAALERAAASMRECGTTPEVLSGGSTPSAADSRGEVLDELRPGVYVFGDAQQWELGVTGPEDIALSCLATVVSHAGGRLVLDSGSKALGADRAPWASGYGRLLDHPGARIVAISEHHAVVEWPAHEPHPEIGDRVRVVPNHACNAVNLADSLTAHQAGRIRERWPVSARGANT